MNKPKENRVIALKQVGVNKKEVEDYRKSSREYFVQYRGMESEVVTSQILEKIRNLAVVRRNQKIEVAGIIFEDNLVVTFVFYVNDDPKDAWYEKSVFMSASDFETELDRQLAPNFIPNVDSKGAHVIYRNGFETEFIALND